MDEHKRFCTLQLIVRFVNGPKSELYAGQPWPEIRFRGQGKAIKPIEKESWHPNVWVAFQPKVGPVSIVVVSWFDTTCARGARGNHGIFTVVRDLLKPDDARSGGRSSFGRSVGRSVGRAGGRSVGRVIQVRQPRG